MMKKALIALSLALLGSAAAFAQTQLQHFPFPGPALPNADGTKLNAIVDALNTLQGTTGTTVPSVINKNNTTNTTSTALASTALQVLGVNGANVRIELDAFGGVPLMSVSRRNGTLASPTAIVSGDQLGGFNFHGASTTALVYGPSATYRAYATENWSGTAGGTKLSFAVTPNTTQVLTDALIIDQDGGLKGINAAQGTAVAIRGGTSSTGGNAGGAVTLTGGTPGITGVGGGITITSGAGGATSGAAGAVAITAGSATSANGASVTITAGAGAASTNAGGSVNLVPGAAVSTGIPGKVQVNADACLISATYYYTGAPAATNQVFFIAPRAMIVTNLTQVHSTAAGGASTLDVTKDTGTTAPAGGTALGQAAFNLNATANTVQNATLSATIATITLAAGDRLAVKYNNTIQSTAGAVVTACMAPL